MKTGELAFALGLNEQTILNWIVRPEFKKFFSPGATGHHGKHHREYTEEDVRVINTIRFLRTKPECASWHDIAFQLEAGLREIEFPPNAIMVDPRTIPVREAEESAKAAATMTERNHALQRVSELQDKIDTMYENHRDEISKMRSEHREEMKELETKIDSIQLAYLKRQEELHLQITELNRELGRLEGQLTRDTALIQK